MKLQKVLALTLLAATVGCASTPVAVKNIAKNDVNTSIVNVNKTGSLSVPVNFPALSNFNTQGANYAGGRVQAVYITVRSLDADNALRNDAQTYVLVRNPYIAAGAAGGSATVTFNSVTAGKAIVSVWTSDQLPNVNAGGVISATVGRANVDATVIDPATMALVTGATPAQAKSDWVSNHAILILPNGGTGVTAQTANSAAKYFGSDGALVTVAAGTSTSAALTVTGRTPTLYDHSVPSGTVVAGNTVSLSGTDLAAGDFAVVDLNHDGVIDTGEYVYPLTVASATAASFAPLKTDADSKIIITRGFNVMSTSTRQINIVPGAVDLSKTAIIYSADSDAVIDAGEADVANSTIAFATASQASRLIYSFYDGNYNLIGSSSGTDTFTGDLDGISVSSATVAAGNKLTAPLAGVISAYAAAATGGAGFTFTSSATAAQFGGRYATITDAVDAGGNAQTGFESADAGSEIPTFTCDGVANYIAPASVLPVGNYTLQLNATKSKLTLKNDNGTEVASYLNPAGVGAALSNGTYMLKSVTDSTTPFISVTLPDVAGTNASAFSRYVVADVRGKGYDTDVLSLTFHKIGQNDATFTVTGTY